MKKAILALALLVLVGLSAPTAHSAPTFGGEVYGAFNTYGMDEFNDRVIGGANEFLEDAFVPERFDEIPTSGVTGGLDLRLWANPTWLITLGWEPVFGSSEVTVSGETATINADAQIFHGTANYFFPSQGQGKFGLGAGFDFVTLTGYVEDPGEKVDLSGSGLGLHVQGMGEWTLSPGFALTGTAGYRLAKVADTKADDESADPKVESDYSGLLARIGLAFYLPSSN